MNSTDDKFLVTRPLSFDEAVEHLIARFEAVGPMSKEDARQFAKDTSVSEKFYPEGFTMMMAKCARTFNPESSGNDPDAVALLEKNERVRYLVTLVHQTRDKVLP